MTITGDYTFSPRNFVIGLSGKPIGEPTAFASLSNAVSASVIFSISHAFTIGFGYNIFSQPNLKRFKVRKITVPICT